MSDTRGPWRVHDVRVAYSNPWLTLREHDVTRPDGQKAVYGVVSPAHLAIAILPVFPDGRIAMIGQHRFPTDRYEWEIPEGGGPLGVDPLESARRELREETGLSAARWLPMLEADLSNSITDEAMYGFIAWELTEGEPQPDGTEILVQRRLPFSEALNRAMSGEFRDMLTVAMLLKAHYMARKGLLEPALAKAILTA